MLKGILGIDDMLDGLETSLLATRIQNAPQEIDIIRAWTNNHDSKENNINDESNGVSDKLTWNWVISDQ